MNITVIGSGYVGLVSGTCFAEMGNKVTCVDIDSVKIEKLNQGVIPIFEPGLETMVLKNVKNKNLFFTTKLHEALKSSEIAFIAVGTPMGDDGSADLQYVLAVAKSIGQSMQKRLIIVDKSTVPIGTADKVKDVIQKELDIRSDRPCMQCAIDQLGIKLNALPNCDKEFMKFDQLNSEDAARQTTRGRYWMHLSRGKTRNPLYLIVWIKHIYRLLIIK